MKFAVVCRLPDSLLVAKLRALTLLENVSEILVFRDMVGPSLPNVRYICPPILVRSIPFIRHFVSLLSLFSVSFRCRPDVFFGIYLVPHGLWSWMAAKFFRRKCVVSLIGSDYDVHLKSRLGFLFRRLLKSCDVVGVKGSVTRAELLASGFSASSVRIFRNTLDVARFKPSVSKKVFDLIYVGRLSREKRVCDLLDAVSILHGRGREVSLAIVGEGPERESLMAQVRGLGISPLVHFLSFVECPERELSKSRVFVLASEREGLPWALVEAMACGLPVVASDVGNICDVVVDEVSGLLVPASNPGLFACAVSRLLDDKVLYQHCVSGVKKKSFLFQPDATVVEWEKLLSEMRLIC